jgi:hypothetical protein
VIAALHDHPEKETGATSDMSVVPEGLSGWHRDVRFGRRSAAVLSTVVLVEQCVTVRHRSYRSTDQRTA